MGHKPKQYPGGEISGAVYPTVSHLVLVPRHSDYMRMSVCLQRRAVYMDKIWALICKYSECSLQSWLDPDLTPDSTSAVLPAPIWNHSSKKQQELKGPLRLSPATREGFV